MPAQGDDGSTIPTIPAGEQGPGYFTLNSPGMALPPGGVVGIPIVGPATRTPQYQPLWSGLMSLATVSNRIVVPTGGVDSIITQVTGATVGAVYPSGPTPAMSHRISMDGYEFVTVSAPSAMTSETISSPVNVSGCGHYALEVTTAAGSAYTVKVTIYGKANT